jgi:hypothetical protein
MSNLFGDALSNSSVEVSFEPATRETTGVETPHGLKAVRGEKNIGPRGLYIKDLGHTAIWLNVSELDNMYNRWAVESRITGIRREIPVSDIERVLSDKKMPGLHVEGFTKLISREDLQELSDFAKRLRGSQGKDKLLIMPPNLFRYIPQLK